MQTVDDKIDAAVHAAFMAMGLSVPLHIALADQLNAQIYLIFGALLTDDDDTA